MTEEKLKLVIMETEEGVAIDLEPTIGEIESENIRNAAHIMLIALQQYAQSGTAYYEEDEEDDED